MFYMYYVYKHINNFHIIFHLDLLANIFTNKYLCIYYFN